MNTIHDKIFDMIFEGTILKTESYYDNPWYGLYKEDNGLMSLIFGRNCKSPDKETWYYDGPTFERYIVFLDYDIKEFKIHLKQYLHNKYGLNIEYIF